MSAVNRPSIQATTPGAISTPTETTKATPNLATQSTNARKETMNRRTVAPNTAGTLSNIASPNFSQSLLHKISSIVSFSMKMQPPSALLKMGLQLSVAVGKALDKFHFNTSKTSQFIAKTGGKIGAIGSGALNSVGSTAQKVFENLQSALNSTPNLQNVLKTPDLPDPVRSASHNNESFLKQYEALKACGSEIAAFNTTDGDGSKIADAKFKYQDPKTGQEREITVREFFNEVSQLAQGTHLNDTCVNALGNMLDFLRKLTVAGREKINNPELRESLKSQTKEIANVKDAKNLELMQNKMQSLASTYSNCSTFWPAILKNLQKISPSNENVGKAQEQINKPSESTKMTTLTGFKTCATKAQGLSTSTDWQAMNRALASIEQFDEDGKEVATAFISALGNMANDPKISPELKGKLETFKSSIEGDFKRIKSTKTSATAEKFIYNMDWKGINRQMSELIVAYNAELKTPDAAPAA